MMNFFITWVILIEFIFCSLTFDTEFGECHLINYGLTFNDVDLQTMIENKTTKLNNDFNPNYIQKKFSLIIDNGNVKISNPQWNWSLGITYYKPEKIIIKDPSFAHISKNDFQKIMEHELNHLMINRIDTMQSIPRWFKEGFAMYYSNEISFSHKLKVAQNITNDNIFNLDNSIFMKNLQKADFQLAYAKSAIYILSIQELYGENTLKNIFNQINEGNNFSDSFYNATSHSLNEFNHIASQYIKNKYWWFRLINLPNKLFTFLPLLLVVGFILQSIKNKKIKERWKLEEELESLDE